MKIYVSSDFRGQDFNFDITGITKQIMNLTIGPNNYNFIVNEINEGKYFSIELWAGAPPVEKNIFIVSDDWTNIKEELISIFEQMISDEYIDSLYEDISYKEMVYIIKKINDVGINSLDYLLHNKKREEDSYKSELNQFEQNLVSELMKLVIVNEENINSLSDKNIIIDIKEYIKLHSSRLYKIKTYNNISSEAIIGALIEIIYNIKGIKIPRIIIEKALKYSYQTKEIRIILREL